MDLGAVDVANGSQHPQLRDATNKSRLMSMIVDMADEEMQPMRSLC